MGRKEGIYLNIKVNPGSKKQNIRQTGLGEYKVNLLAPPSKGKANQELIQILADSFKIPAASIIIVKGHKSRLKRIFIDTSRNQHIRKRGLNGSV